jgi:pullulanase/glycogen debranching enzyme
MRYILEHQTNKKLSPGSHGTFGATLEQDGVNFALFSNHAQEVFLLLF